MTQENTMLVLRASRLLIVLATMAMMFWTFGTANATTSDKDGDGLLNGQERNVTHTSPVKADTDGDHIKDGNEDSDNDGVDNTDENKVGTQMGDADSDNDGTEDEDDDCDGTEDEDDNDDDQGEDEQ